MAKCWSVTVAIIWGEMVAGERGEEEKWRKELLYDLEIRRYKVKEETTGRKLGSIYL